jgi:phosphate-selective porin OprO/OprP
VNALFWRRLGGLGAAVTFALMAQPTFGQETQETIEQRLDKLEKQNEALQKQNQQLLQLLTNAQTSPAANTAALSSGDVRSIVTNYLAEQEQQKNKDEAAAKKDAGGWHAVGSDLNMSGKWENALWFYTPSKDFAFRVRGRIQNDWGWFAPDDDLEPRGWHDGADFRRARIGVQGTAWEVMNYTVEWDFAEGGTVAATDIYMDITNLPLAGTFRVGNFYEPFALEEYGTGDLYTTFMERSVANDAFNPNRHLGLMLYNNAGDGLVTWAGGLFRASRTSNASAEESGDGEYAWTGRLTCNPWYAHDGRCVFMFGGAASYRSLTNQPDRDATNGPLAGINNTARFRTRIPLRVNGTTGVNSERVVDSGPLVADNAQLYNLQALLILGPFSLQAESYWVQANEALESKTKTRTDLSYSGFYVEASYFLTGENRRYNRATASIDRSVVLEKFFLVNGEGGWRNLHFGRGAWQLISRYEYIDLGNPVVTHDFQGREQDVVLGVNWFLSPTFRVQFNYVLAHIDGLNTLDTNQSGTVHAFGTRFQWDW